jgi:hypothetical protein
MFWPVGLPLHFGVFQSQAQNSSAVSQNLFSSAQIHAFDQKFIV